jgi:thermostable 8-oxoguanine DNA glycosylase
MLKSRESEAELQWRLVYSVIVAGKSAAFAEKAMRRLFPKQDTDAPFDSIRLSILPDRYGLLDNRLRAARTGNYRKLNRCLRELVTANLDLSTCEPFELEAIHGIGPKTSRFFILWTRPEALYAALDTHILKWLRYLGHDAPMATPSSPALYAKLEKIMLAEAAARQMTPRELDATIWEWCNGRFHKNGEWPERLHREWGVTPTEMEVRGGFP